MPGRRDHLDSQIARLDRAGRHLEAEPTDELVVSCDVVGVVVRDQQMGGFQAVALDHGEKLLERCARVDEHSGPVLVCEQIGIREPRRVHAAFDAHVQMVRERIARA